MLNKDQMCLLAILEAIDKIEAFSKDFSGAEEFNLDVKSFDASMMNFIVIGEMANKLSDQYKEKQMQIDWPGIISLRNIAAHDYFGIDYDEVWEIINKDLIALKIALTNLLQ